MEQGGQLSAGRVMGWRRPAHTVAYSRKGQFLRQSSYGLSGGVGGDFRPVGRREALGGGFCAIQRLGGAPAGRQRRTGVKEVAGEQGKEASSNLECYRRRVSWQHESARTKRE